MPKRPQRHEIVTQRAMFEEYFVDRHTAEGRSEIGVFREVNSLATGISAADMQADPNALGEPSNQIIKNFSRPFALVRRFRPCRFVELNILASGGDDPHQVFKQHIGPGAAKRLVVRIEILSLVDAESREDMRPR